MTLKGTIIGHVPSKSNQYEIINVAGKDGKKHASLRKSAEVKRYERDFALQCRHRRARIYTPFCLSVEVFLPTQKQDLDNTAKVFLDCLQACEVITNDNLCVEFHAKKIIDKKNPRVNYVISTI